MTRGFWYCVIADLLYSLAFFLIRCLTEYRELSPDWTLCVKESVTVLTALPILLIQTIRGRYRYPSWNTFVALLIAGFFCQYVGARANLRAYAAIGLVLAIPLIQTFLLLGTAVLDTVCLKEKMTRYKMFVLVLLIAAISLLSFSQASVDSGQRISFSNQAIWGIAMTLATGFGYTVFMLILRATLRRERPDGSIVPEVPLTLVILVICFVGALVGALCFLNDPTSGSFWDVPTPCWWLALSAGVATFFAFFFKNLGLRHASATKVVFIAVVQIVCLTLLGIFFFHEDTNTFVWLGLLLTCIGVLCAGRMK